MSTETSDPAFSIVFELRDGLAEELELVTAEELDGIDELRRLSEEMSGEPVQYLTRS